MIVRPVVTRSQRRVERKQVVLILALVLMVAGVSFALGVKFGERGCTFPSLSGDVNKPKLPMVTKVTLPLPPAAETVVAKPAELTFYDNLPKGNQAPLGSGINLPPEEKPLASAVEKQAVAESSEKSIDSVPKSPVIPGPAANGTFLVQVASFRTGADAAKLTSRLKSHNMDTFVETANLGEKGVWHRVLAGPYATRESAEQVAALLLEKERLLAIVRQR